MKLKLAYLLTVCAIVVCCLTATLTYAQSSDCIDPLLLKLDHQTDQPNQAELDTMLIKTYWQKWRAVIFNKPDSAYEYAVSALNAALAMRYGKGIAGSLLRIGNAFQYQANYTEAETFIRCAIEYEKASGTPKTLAIALSDLGIVLYNTSQNDSAHYYLDQSVEVARTNNLPRFEANALQNKARAYNKQGYHKLAADCNYASLALFEELDSKSMMAGGYNTLGATYVYAEEFAKGIEMFRKTANITAELGDTEKRFHAEALMNMAHCFRELNMYDSAYHYSDLSYEPASQAGDIIGTVIALYGKGNGLNNMGKYDQAIEILKHNIDRSDSLGISYYYNLNHIQLADAYINTNQIFQARSALNKINKERLKSNPRNVIRYLTTKSKLLEKENRHDDALVDFKKLSSIQDSMSKEKELTEIEELTIIYNLEKKEKEIALLNERSQKDKWRVGALIMGLLASIFLGLLAVAAQRRRARLRRERDQKRLAKVESEKATLTGVVQAKDREITAKSIVSVRQQDEMRELKKSLTALSDQSSQNAHEFQKLIRKVDQHIATDQGWKQVLETFTEVHPGFIEGLKEQFPALTSSDLRLAALMRMNLDSKTIATLLNISPDSVKRARNRFRQKIDITTDIRLQDWIIAREI